mmetsp:Transcript_46605/g.125152  ORF Transcript_46605/g.125152 Transcript_46605/m.125152 type:complete len:225 (+) Transcript_46605:319-993(+)
MDHRQAAVAGRRAQGAARGGVGQWAPQGEPSGELDLRAGLGLHQVPPPPIQPLARQGLPQHRRHHDHAACRGGSAGASRPFRRQQDRVWHAHPQQDAGGLAGGGEGAWRALCDSHLEVRHMSGGEPGELLGAGHRHQARHAPHVLLPLLRALPSHGPRIRGGRQAAAGKGARVRGGAHGHHQPQHSPRRGGRRLPAGRLPDPLLSSPGHRLRQAPAGEVQWLEQ